MKRDLLITQTSNDGYIVDNYDGVKMIFLTLEEAIEYVNVYYKEIIHGE